MAITLRGKLTETENNGNVNSLTCANTGQAITAGDALVVIVRTGTGTASSVTVADNVNAGNYIKAVEAVDATNLRTVGIYIKPNSAAVAAGSLTVTATLSGTAHPMAMNGLVYIGVAASSPVDQTNSAVFATATTTPSSGNITTTVSGDAVIGAFGIQTTSLATVSSEGGSFAQEFNDTLGTTGHQHLHVADQILTGISTLAYAPTLSVAAPGVICVASLKPLVFILDEPPSGLPLQGQGPLGLADEWTPRVPPPPLFEWDESQRWQLNRDQRVSWSTSEIYTGLLPIIPQIIYDDDPSRSFDVRGKQEDEPWHTFFLIPVPPPTLGWDDWDWSRDYSPVYTKPPEGEPFDFTQPIVPPLAFDESAAWFTGSSGSLAAMLVMDEFVNAPSGSVAFGPAPSGRSARFGFAISSFR